MVLLNFDTISMQKESQSNCSVERTCTRVYVVALIFQKKKVRLKKMSAADFIVYVSRLLHEFDKLRSVGGEGDQRRREFCRLCIAEFVRHGGATRSPMYKVLRDLMNCRTLFPGLRDEKYFLKYALDRRSVIMIRLLRVGGVNIHELCLENRHSALHYLSEVKYRKKFHGDYVITKLKTINVMEYFFKRPKKNYQDSLGYTYFHAACMSGNLSAVNLFLSQLGVDVNLDTYTCSPLHMAAQYRHAEILEILLEHGANANQLDAEKSTPLHALARLCLCQCTDDDTLCDKRKPVDELVKFLLDHGADMEARNCHGLTPLGLSVCRFDLELTRTFLKYGAKIENLHEDNLFTVTFKSLELKNYPLTLNIIEMAHLLKSAGYNLSLHARLRMMKYWMKIRGNDTDHFISDYTEFLEPVTKRMIIQEVMQRIFLCREFGFYLPQETEDLLLKKCKFLDPFNDHYRVFKPRSSLAETLTVEVERTKEIMLTDNISLYEMLRMSYSEGYSTLKGITNLRLSAMEDISCTYVNLIAKRYLANVLIRPHLERVVADLFMNDHCKLNLPYLACLNIAEHMSDEDLFRLCQQTDENQLRPNTIRPRKRCHESRSSASSEPPMRRSRRLRGLPAIENHS
uniref:Uncharacterized protein n=1 Tax=Trichogramma kaykai TaxID=54128 RepID=A0ABD2XLI5_9HYME